MLAILTTHPIQYQVPLWQKLAEDDRVDFEVWFLTRHGIKPTVDRGFRRSFTWDIPLLTGYRYRFLEVNDHWDVGNFHSVRLCQELAPLMRLLGVKVLWIQGWQVLAYWQAVWQARRIGVEIWVRGESNDLAPVPWWKAPAKHFFTRALFRRIDRFLYIGSANRRFYLRYGVHSEQLFPALYSVDTNRFAQAANKLRGERTSLRRKWRIPEGAFCLLFCGKFIAKKRPLDVIAAASELLWQDPHLRLHLLFAGDGELRKRMIAKCRVVFDSINPQGLEPKTAWTRTPPASFIGFLNQTEMPEAYIAADCLVLPSDYRETWGLVVNEAMASGLPCVVSDTCGCAEDLVAPARPTLVFKMGVIEDMIRAIREIIASPKHSGVLTDRVKAFSFDAVRDTVEKLLANPIRIE